MKQLLIFILIVGAVFQIEGQDNTNTITISSLTKQLNGLRIADTDSLKEVLNLKFKTDFLYFLENETFGKRSFDSLITVGKIWSDDELVGVFSWNIEQENHTQKYFAFVLKKNERTGKILITELIDISTQENIKPKEVLNADEWYGALYYDIIDVKKGNKTYYTLLGWDGGYINSNIKLLDALTFSGNDPKLGAPIFKLTDKVVKRVFYEHSERSYMSLKYDTERRLIIFDHLSPETPNLVGFYDYYVPDLSYDGFKWEKDKWVIKEDILALNGRSQRVNVATPNADGSYDVNTKENKWENPTANGSGDFSHKSAKPTDETGKEIKTKDNGKKKRGNASDKDPNATYSEKDFEKGGKKFRRK
jgi:hypothetical protein